MCVNVLEAIGKRHSYRGKYSQLPISRDDLKTIMEAGLAAPSGCNMQTVSVIGVDDLGSIMVRWDNGCGLSVAWGADRCRRIEVQK